MVIHREPEEDGEQEEGHPRRDEIRLAEPEDLVPDPVLKDEDHEAVGRADGEQVEDDRLRREHDRPECDGQ